MSSALERRCEVNSVSHHLAPADGVLGLPGTRQGASSYAAHERAVVGLNHLRHKTQGSVKASSASTTHRHALL
jgi:hypothetical protein